MKQHQFGVRITSISVEAVLLTSSKEKGGVLELVGSHRSALATGVVVDGWVKKPEHFKRAIQELISKIAGPEVELGSCVVVIPSAATFTSVFRFPAGLRRKEVLQTIPYVAEESLPFDSPEVYYDVRFLGAVDAVQEVLYIAAPAIVVEHWRAQLTDCGVDVGVIETSAVAATRGLVRASLQAPIWGVLQTDDRPGGLSLVAEQAIRYHAPMTTIKAKTAKTTKANGAGVVVSAGLDDAQADLGIAPDVVVVDGELTAELEKILAKRNVEVVVGDPLLEMKVTNPPKERLSGAVVGAALRAHLGIDQDVNLLPIHPATAKRAGWADIPPRRKKGYVWALGILVGLLAIIFTTQAFGYDIVRMGLFAIRNTVTVKNVDDAVLEELRAKRRQRAADAAAAAIETPPVEETTATSTPTSTPAVTNATVTVLPNDLGYLNIRTGPSSATEKVGTAKVGDSLQVLEAKNDWMRIRTSAGTEGWVSSIYVGGL